MNGMRVINRDCENIKVVNSMKFKFCINNLEYDGKQYGVKVEGNIEVNEFVGELLMSFMKTDKVNEFDGNEFMTYAKNIMSKADDKIQREFVRHWAIIYDIYAMFSEIGKNRITLEVV